MEVGNLTILNRSIVYLLNPAVSDSKLSPFETTINSVVTRSASITALSTAIANSWLLFRVGIFLITLDSFCCQFSVKIFNGFFR